MNKPNRKILVNTDNLKKVLYEASKKRGTSLDNMKALAADITFVVKKSHPHFTISQAALSLGYTKKEFSVGLAAGLFLYCETYLDNFNIATVLNNKEDIEDIKNLFKKEITETAPISVENLKTFITWLETCQCKFSISSVAREGAHVQFFINKNKES
tara:strand:+ start:1008 stop:1478 length:471 start_codon:yes stop_codon:yes gene_type:complete